MNWIKCSDGTLVNPAYVEAIEPVTRPGGPPVIRFRTPSLIRTLEDPTEIARFLELVGVGKVDSLEA